MKLTALRDRRLTKGVLIGAAGLALLVGGGTFALWNDSENIPGGSINSGELHLDLSGAATWSNQDGPITNFASYLIVPGDVVTLNQGVSITATGDSLAAQLTMDTSGLTGDLALRTALQTSMVVQPPLLAGMTAGGAGVYNLTGAFGTNTVTVQVTLTLPASVSGLTAQNETVNLSSVEFDLVQLP